MPSLGLGVCSAKLDGQSSERTFEFRSADSNFVNQRRRRLSCPSFTLRLRHLRPSRWPVSIPKHAEQIALLEQVLTHHAQSRRTRLNTTKPRRRTRTGTANPSPPHTLPASLAIGTLRMCRGSDSPCPSLPISSQFC